MPLRAIIFDFDGLILDTETPEVRAWQKVFRSRGAEFPDSWWIHAIGRGADQIQESPIEVLERQLGYPCERMLVMSEYESLRLADIEASPVLPGITELIQAALAEGVKLGVASSSKHAWVDRHLGRIGLLDSFGAILCADDVQNAKPFSDLYVAACARLGVAPSEAIALEDSPNGIKAAKAAGLVCVAIPNACTVRLSLSDADHQVDTATDLDLPMLVELLQTAEKRHVERMAANPQNEQIKTHFGAITDEMKSLGVWETAKPSDEAFENMGAFGLNTMALEQWLRWVFVPTMEDRLADGGPWPSSSSIGTVAIRNFDGRHEYSHLISLLCEFDRLF
ncbi:MAG: YqcC family protein [Chlorobia bacterium]|nr:YqcC family protein [Fimbriimonadaceae bacterium]